MEKLIPVGVMNSNNTRIDLGRIIPESDEDHDLLIERNGKYFFQ